MSEDDQADLAVAYMAGFREGQLMERERCALVVENYAAEKEADAETEDDPDYRERYLAYAKHVRSAAAAIRKETP